MGQGTSTLSLYGMTSSDLITIAASGVWSPTFAV